MAGILQMEVKGKPIRADLTPDVFMREYAEKRRASASQKEVIRKPEGAEATGGEELRKYSSTQVNLPGDMSDYARAFAAKIPDGDLAEDGRETEPHITVRWGLHTDDHDKVAKVITGHGPIKARVKTVSIFPAKKGQPHDVVKADVESRGLHTLHHKIGKTLDNTKTHKIYRPHITLAYVKAGTGKKYAGRVVPKLSGKSINFDHVVFSPHEGEKTVIPLGEPLSALDSNARP
jgi:2'-5' RNA ligase